MMTGFQLSQWWKTKDEKRPQDSKFICCKDILHLLSVFYFCNECRYTYKNDIYCDGLVLSLLSSPFTPPHMSGHLHLSLQFCSLSGLSWVLVTTLTTGMVSGPPLTPSWVWWWSGPGDHTGQHSPASTRSPAAWAPPPAWASRPAAQCSIPRPLPPLPRYSAVTSDYSPDKITTNEVLVFYNHLGVVILLKFDLLTPCKVQAGIRPVWQKAILVIRNQGVGFHPVTDLEFDMI